MLLAHPRRRRTPLGLRRGLTGGNVGSVEYGYSVKRSFGDDPHHLPAVLFRDRIDLHLVIVAEQPVSVDAKAIERRGQRLLPRYPLDTFEVPGDSIPVPHDLLRPGALAPLDLAARQLGRLDEFHRVFHAIIAKRDRPLTVVSDNGISPAWRSSTGPMDPQIDWHFIAHRELQRQFPSAGRNCRTYTHRSRGLLGTLVQDW